MYILGIDTSCDDTCISILKGENNQFEIISNIISSQVKLHAKYGGVYPSLAKREHQRNLAPVLKKALERARLLKLKIKNEKLKITIKNSKVKGILAREPELYKKTIDFLKKYEKPDIDAIAVTVGPGLEPALWVGVNFAKALSYFWQKPILPINHIEGHISANFIQNPISKIQFPAICLVVSGGHTQLILMRKIGSYKLIGETRDDAAGECFDKVARILGLGYPGGPAIAAEATNLNLKSLIFNLHLPRPMMYTKNYDFSFSGLKTAILYKVRSMKSEETKKKDFIREMCAEIQQAIIDVLIHKTIKAAKDFRVKTIILGGGVAANDELRRQFDLNLKSEILNLKFLVPPKIFCTDNAAMVAVAAYSNRKKAGRSWKNIKADGNLKI